MVQEASEAEDDVFSDAQEARNSHSGPSSPIPKPRVEQVNLPLPSMCLSTSSLNLGRRGREISTIT